MKDDNEYSGNIKLRLPKNLHEILINSAKNDGVSLNQYCVHVLSDHMRTSMGREKLNRELKKIQNNSSDIKFEDLAEKLEPLCSKVKVLSELIEFEDFKTTKTLTSQDEFYLEFKYPVLIYRISSKKFNISIKIPTIKMIIEPQNYNYKIQDRREIEDLIQKIDNVNQSFFLTIGNIDDINFTHSIEFDFKKADSLVLYFLNEDLNTTKNKISEISDKLEEINCIKNKQFLIKYSPTYFLKPVFKN